MPDERREVALPGGLVGHGCGREAVGAPPRPAAFSASSPSRAVGPLPSAPSSNSRPLQRRPGPGQPPHGLRQAPALLRPRSGRGPAPHPMLASAASPRQPRSVWNLQKSRGQRNTRPVLSGGSAHPVFARAPRGRGPGVLAEGIWGNRSIETLRLAQPGHVAMPVPGSRSHEHSVRNQRARQMGPGERDRIRTAGRK